MKTVGIVAEYNPFHNGHLYQINRIREAFGEDTVIVAVMSGNFVQRGLPAFYNKYFRAECAVRCGVNLVLEIPPPYSFSSARDFAKAAVSIIEKLGNVDCLAFGVEDASVETLYDYVRKVPPDDSVRVVSESFQKSESRLFAEKFGTFYPEKPNDILGAEYVRALEDLKSKITPYAIKRKEAFSAHRARKILSDGKPPNGLIPDNIVDSVVSFPKADERVYQILAFNAALNCDDVCYCCKGGEAGFIRASASKAASPAEFFENLSCGRFSRSHLRRAVLSGLVGAYEADVRKEPDYTVLLGSDEKGKDLLSRIRKKKSINIITKPAKAGKTGFLIRADVLYSQLTDISAGDVFRFSPYIAD